MHFVYVLLCPKCGCPRYVGQTDDLGRRHAQHLRGSAVSDASHHKKRWVQQLLDVGLVFGSQVLAAVETPAEADEAEVYWIEFLGGIAPLTNIAPGGEAPMRGRKHSEATRAKMSKSAMGLKNALGAQRSPATRRLMGLAKLGNKNPFGHRHSAASKAKMRAAIAARRG